MVVRRKHKCGNRVTKGGEKMHSHLSSNYTTTLITLRLELIARVRGPAVLMCSFVIAAKPQLLPALC